MITCAYDGKNQMGLVIIHPPTLLNTFYIIWTHIYDRSDSNRWWGSMTGPAVCICEYVETFLVSTVYIYLCLL